MRAKKLLAKGLTQSETARELGVSRQCIHQYFPGKGKKNTENRQRRIINAFARGLSREEIARKFGLTAEYISQIGRSLRFIQRKKIRHGTPTRYVYGCRCKRCRAASARRAWEYYWRKRTA